MLSVGGCRTVSARLRIETEFVLYTALPCRKRAQASGLSWSTRDCLQAHQQRRAKYLVSVNTAEGRTHVEKSGLGKPKSSGVRRKGKKRQSGSRSSQQKRPGEEQTRAFAQSLIDLYAAWENTTSAATHEPEELEERLRAVLRNGVKSRVQLRRVLGRVHQTGGASKVALGILKWAYDETAAPLSVQQLHVNGGSCAEAVENGYLSGNAEEFVGAVGASVLDGNNECARSILRLLIAEGKLQEMELEELDATSFSVDSGIAFDSAVGKGVDGMEAGEIDEMNEHGARGRHQTGARFLESHRRRVYTEALVAYSRQGNAQELQSLFEFFKRSGVCLPMKVFHDVMFAIVGVANTKTRSRRNPRKPRARNGKDTRNPGGHSFDPSRIRKTTEDVVLRMAVHHNLEPDAQLCNSALQVKGILGAPSDIEECMEWMDANGTSPDTKSYTILLNSYAKSNNLKKCEEVLRRMIALDIKPNIFTYNSLVAAFCRAGRMLEAERVFRRMQTEHCPPDVCTFCTLLTGYASAGEIEEAERVGERMKKAKLAPTLSYYNALLDMYSSVGRAKDALAVKDEAERNNLELDVVGYTTLVKLYCSLGELSEAKEIVETMKSLPEVHPGLRAYVLLLDAYGKVSG